ncbi:MAG: glycosyltransferase [Bacteroidales bacterium]|nr:glycosyltransferase [Bacteroidales bacterium]
MAIIAVSAAALTSSGALAVYKQFLSHLKDCVGDDTYIIFKHKTMPAIDLVRVSYIDIDIKSFKKRIIFDWFECKKILNKRAIFPDIIISLQNTGLLCYRRVRQIVYYHQSIPFYKNRWNPFDRSEALLFFYKWFYPLFVKISLRRTTDVVVQIPYMKRCFITKFKFPSEKVHVLFPDVERINVSQVVPYEWKDDKIHLVYPSTPFKYKNHSTIVKALYHIKLTNNSLYKRISIHFTFRESDYPSLAQEIDSLEVRQAFSFSPPVPHELLLSMMASSSALLFPSTIETIGLPLLEASSFGLPILAADMDYAREVLNGYGGVYYCDPNNPENWANTLESVLNESKRYMPTSERASSWTAFFAIVGKGAGLESDN